MLAGNRMLFDLIGLVLNESYTHLVNCHSMSTIMCTGLLLCNPNHCSDALQVYVPWCGHCKKLEPEYNRLGEVLQNIPSIVIAKVDDTKNEHALVQVSLFFAFLSLVLGLLDALKAITSPTVLNLFLVILSSSRIALGNLWDSRSLSQLCHHTPVSICLVLTTCSRRISLSKILTLLTLDTLQQSFQPV
jgi:thiol-disulfide isomerase/thioredoxin